MKLQLPLEHAREVHGHGGLDGAGDAWVPIRGLGMQAWQQTQQCEG